MGGGSPSTTRTIQDIPSEFKPAYTSLYNSAMGAARAGAYPSILQNNPIYAGIPSMGQLGSYGFPQAAQGMGGGFGMGGYTPYPMAGTGAQPAGITSQGQRPAQGGFGQSNLMASTQPALTPGTGAQPTSQTGGKGGRGGGLRKGEQQQQAPYQLPSGNVWGSSQIPLAGGEPIVGQPFPGPFTAPTNPLEVASQMGKLGAAGQMQGLGQNLMNLGQAQAGGAFLMPQSNPFLAESMRFAMQPAVEQFTRGTLPAFESQALQSGAFKGSSARDMATAQLASDFGRNLMGTTGMMGLQNLMAERQLQQGSGQMLDEAARLMQLQPELIGQVGAGLRGFDQRMLDEALLQYQEQIQAPFRPLMPLASIIHGGDIGQSITQMTPQPSPAASGIIGALGGAGLGANVASTAGWGNLGTGLSSGIGGLAGGLAGLLG